MEDGGTSDSWSAARVNKDQESKRKIEPQEATCVCISDAVLRVEDGEFKETELSPI